MAGPLNYSCNFSCQANRETTPAWSTKRNRPLQSFLLQVIAWANFYESSHNQVICTEKVEHAEFDLTNAVAGILPGTESMRCQSTGWRVNLKDFREPHDFCSTPSKKVNCHVPIIHISRAFKRGAVVNSCSTTGFYQQNRMEWYWEPATAANSEMS